MSKPCPAEQCGAEIGPHQLLCDDCWGLLSQSHRRAVAETFSRHKVGSAARLAAEDGAIRAASAARKKFAE